MLVIFYGTSAELIKILGVTSRIPRQELLLICSAQHRDGLRKVHKQLGVEPSLYLSDGWKGHDVANMKQMAGMMLTAHISFGRQYFKLKKMIRQHDVATGTKSIAVVHGDTLTTVIGAYMGRLLGLPVAHIEAGLRSGSWKNPFPEELDRRFVSKIARIHFAPNATAVRNLERERAKGIIIDTIFNTAKDSIEMSEQYVSKEFQRLNLPDHYCLILLHRTELLENKADLEAILKTIAEHASAETPVIFTEHTTTKEKIQEYGLSHYLETPGITPIPKQSYFDFMAIVKQSEYIVTDGGGLQEDAFFFGIPTMVHRKTTEREEGLGSNAAISRMDVKKVAAFLQNHQSKTHFQAKRGGVSPSTIVIDWFKDHAYVSRSSKNTA